MLVETMGAARQAADATASTVPGPFHVLDSPERALGDDVSPESDGDRCLVGGVVTDTNPSDSLPHVGLHKIYKI